jgi:adenylate cyclase
MSTTTAEDVGWPELQRARRAIVVVDVVESVRLMQQHETDVINRWRRFVNEVQTQVLPKHGGRLVKSLGDGMLLEFEHVPAAIACALDLRERVGFCNEGRAPDAHVLLRIGVHVSEVVLDALDVFGAGVNLAARLAALAPPQSIVVSAEVRDELVPDIDADLEDLGECYLKHIAQPVRAYKVFATSQGERHSGAPPSHDDLRPTLAVLPFDVRVTSKQDVVIGTLLADELIAVLSQGSPLRVISRLSTSSLRERLLSLPQMGAALGATYVLSGRVTTNGTRLSIFAELADVRSGNVVIARSVTADIGEIAAPRSGVVCELASLVCDAILQHQLSRVRHLPLPTLESYALLLAGVSFMHRFSASDFQRAKTCLEALAERVPRHATPHAWLARWHVFHVLQGWSTDPAADRVRARELSSRALDIDPDSTLALTVAGSVEVGLLKNLDKAQQCYRDALRINPSEPLAWLLLGTAHAFKGEGQEAMHAAEQATRLSPLDPLRFFYDSHAASAAASAGEFDRAIELAERSLRANRMHHSTYRVLAIAQAMSGRVDDARKTVAELLTFEPGLTVEAFLERSPGGRFEHGRQFAEALRAAGLPQMTPQ